MRKTVALLLILAGWPVGERCQAEDFADVLTRYRTEFAKHAGYVTFEKCHNDWQIAHLGVGWDLPIEMGDSQLAALSHVKSLQLTRSPTAGLRILSQLQELRRLSLSFRYTKSDLEALAGFPRLEVLGLPPQDPEGIGSQRVAGLEKLHNIRRLNLAAVGLADAALDDVAALAQLEELDVSHNHRISDSGVAKLGGLSGLRVLGIDKLGEEGLSALGRLPHLERLDIGAYSPPTDRGKGDLSNLRGLKSLGVYGIRGNRGGIRLPEGVRRLGTSCSAAKNFALQSASQIANVEVHLDSYNKQASLVWLASLPHLTELTLVDAIDADLAAVAGLSSLRSLSIGGFCPGMTFGDEGMKAVGTLRQLESLVIDISRITDTGIGVVRNLTDLRRLKLSALPNVSRNGLAEIWNLKRLRVLELSYVGEPDKSSDDILADLRKLSELEELTLRSVSTGLRQLLFEISVAR